MNREKAPAAMQEFFSFRNQLLSGVIMMIAGGVFVGKGVLSAVPASGDWLLK